MIFLQQTSHVWFQEFIDAYHQIKDIFMGFIWWTSGGHLGSI